MTELNESILKLRVRAFYLFLLPALALIGSLLVSNYIVEFNFKPNYYKVFELQNKSYDCDSGNGFCDEYNFFPPKAINQKIIECGKYNTEIVLSSSKGNFIEISEFSRLNSESNMNLEITNQRETSILLTENSKFKILFKESDKKNQDCIKNSKLYFLYKIYPSPFEYLYNFKMSNDYQSAASNAIFPFFFGESSISNLVKRFPINYIFKPLIYIGCIFMILFWYSYNHVVNQISSTNKFNNFLIFGFLSCMFLFLHVLLLGLEIDNKIFKLSRKIIIVSFILFEVIAQYSLLKKIYLLKDKISNLINEIYLKLKILLVGFVILATIFIVIILLIYDLAKKFDYILEWNYFLILLFYYLLSFFMWKKKT